jgi:adenosylcobinamide-GDP ribazoletransferase
MNLSGKKGDPSAPENPRPGCFPGTCQNYLSGLPAILMADMSVLQPVIALLQFTTVIPLGRTAPFESFAQRCWLYPVAGYVTGGLSGLVLFLLPVPPAVAGVLGVGLLLLLTGCNHLDGLLDLGDGLMAHGGREVRIRALTDRTIGTGGLALGMILLLLAVQSLAAAQIIWVAVLCGEVFAKYSMAMMTICGKPFHAGLHATLHEQTRPWFIIPATLLLLPVLFLPAAPVTVIWSAVVAVLVPATLLLIAKRLFGGVNGDVTGASGEITRACVFVVFACTANVPVSGMVLRMIS